MVADRSGDEFSSVDVILSEHELGLAEVLRDGSDNACSRPTAVGASTLPPSNQRHRLQVPRDPSGIFFAVVPQVVPREGEAFWI